MANGLKPFKVKPFIVWTCVIALLVIVIYASSRSNYTTEPPTSPTTVIPSQIPDNKPEPVVSIPPNLFPEPPPSLGMKEVNLVSRTHLGAPVHMSSLEEVNESLYDASFDDIFKASEQQGIVDRMEPLDVEEEDVLFREPGVMEKSPDALFDIMKVKAPLFTMDEE
jgi:hypothetical protein